MKRILQFLMVLGLGSVLAPDAGALRLDFARMYSEIRFDGNDPTNGVGTFRFVPPSPENQFIITESDGTGSARNLLGGIDGTFSIGAITVNGARQTAPVLGEGTLRIRDFAGHDLTGTLEWNQINVVTLSSLISEGNLNTESVLNLTAITYDGGVADLVALAAAGTGRVILDFQFVSPLDTSLMGLTRDGSLNTARFRGSIVAVPEPAAWALWGLGVAGLACGARRKAKGHHARGSR